MPRGISDPIVRNFPDEFPIVSKFIDAKLSELTTPSDQQHVIIDQIVVHASPMPAQYGATGRAGTREE